MRRARRIAIAASFALVVAASGGACAQHIDKSGATGATDHDAGADGALDTGFVLTDGAPTDTHLDPDATCLRDPEQSTRIPPSILILFDRSASMADCPDAAVTNCPGATKWAEATTAIEQLLLSLPKDLRFGIKFFGTNDDSCADADYAKPDVPIGPLSLTQVQIDCWLGAASCAGITPMKPLTLTEMAPALRGGIRYLRAIPADGARIVILITDGDPSNCDATNQVADVIAAAANGWGGTPKVRTYVIGVPGATVSNLSQIASAGNGKRTPSCVAGTLDPLQACEYQIGAGNVEADLQAALYDITNKARTCTFKIPPPSGDAAAFDPGQVNVDVTTAGTTTELPRDTTQTNGWDYTDGGDSVTIFGPTCDTILTDDTTTVDVVFGCPTKMPS